MNDPEIRAKLLPYLGRPGIRVIQEFPTKWGYTRADVVTIGDTFDAYEIKSAKDNLSGLPKQQRYYSMLFDTVTVVTESKWVKGILKIVPNWWGIWECVEKPKKQKNPFSTFRLARPNPQVHPMQLVGILWSSEVRQILLDNDFTNIRSLRRDELWHLAATEIDLYDLRKAVRQTLKDRVYIDPKRNICQVTKRS